MKRRGFWVVAGLVLAIVIMVLARSAQREQKVEDKSKIVRMPAVAGSWYPGDREGLAKAVSSFLEKAEKPILPGKVKAVIVPHAGYAYSGQIAADSFAQLNGRYPTVLLLGPSHHYPLEGLGLSNATHYRTPLGDVKIAERASHLMMQSYIPVSLGIDKQEHSLEIELPFLQEKLGDFEVIPILVGRVDPGILLQQITPYIDDNTLVVVSVDMSHYHSYKDAVALDNATIQNILKLDDKAIFSNEIDAPWAVSTLLMLAKEKGWSPHLVKYMNSGDVTGDKGSVVGYSGIVFTKNESEGLDGAEQKFLTELARKTLDSYYADGKAPAVDETELTESLTKEQGCFVTLNKYGILRGCIGHILPQESLYQCVIDNALNAALHDSRFKPVTKEELKDIDIEISVLSVPERLEFSSWDDLKNKLVPLRDGVVLKSGWHQSTYLPQVWEDLPDKEEFLSSLCTKGGANQDCWKDTGTEVDTYQAQVFAEK